MRLRLERQRPSHVARVVEELRTRMDSVAEQDGDDAVHTLAKVEATRRSLLDAVDALSVALAQTRRQITLDVSSMEIDRRVSERRGGGEPDSSGPSVDRRRRLTEDAVAAVPRTRAAQSVGSTSAALSASSEAAGGRMEVGS